MGEVFAGRYELVDPLASGGGGVIWRVWDQRKHEYHAGKVLKQSHSDSLLRFMRETSWRVDHKHVLTPLGWAGEDDKVMFTMRLIRGGSLAQVVKEQGALPPAWAVTIIDQLLDALTAVHAQELVHRDIKPANILLEPTDGGEPFIYLSDFGIAAPVGEPRMTRASEVIGTPGYMSPEAQYGADPTPQQDLYSVGVVLLEMLTGRRPPSDGTPEIPAAAADLPLGRFIAKLLDEETRRYQSCAEAREALRNTPLPSGSGRPIIIPDRIPDWPEGWTDAGPDAGGSRAETRPNVIPAGGSTTSLPAGQQLPMQPAAGSHQHRPAPGWGGGFSPSTYSPSTGRGVTSGPGLPTQRPVPTLMMSPTQQPFHAPQGFTPHGGQSQGNPTQAYPQGYSSAVAAQKRSVFDRFVALPEVYGWGLFGLGIVLAAIALWQLIS